jgi:hypothetical protein
MDQFFHFNSYLFYFIQYIDVLVSLSNLKAIEKKMITLLTSIFYLSALLLINK